MQQTEVSVQTQLRDLDRREREALGDGRWLEANEIARERIDLQRTLNLPSTIRRLPDDRPSRL